MNEKSHYAAHRCIPKLQGITVKHMQSEISTELTIKDSPIAYNCGVRGDADKRRTLGGIQLEQDRNTSLGHRDCGRICCYLAYLVKASLVLFRLGAHFNSAQYGIGKSPVAITGLVCLRFHCCHRGF